MNNQERNTSLSRFRSAFPHVQTGICWLNHAATSPFSTPVIQALQFYTEQRTSASIDPWPEDITVRDAIRRHLSTLCGIKDTRNIALLHNTSAGINILAQGLRWAPGDRILLYRNEFPANVYPYLHLKSRGVEIDWIEDLNGTVPEDAIARALTPRTRLLSMSSVQYSSGWKSDLKKVAELCRKNGTFLVVDAIQSIGAVPMHAEDWGIHALVAGSHKWQMGPAGAGFLYISPEMAAHIDPPVFGWLSVETPWEFGNYAQNPAPGALIYEAGSPPALAHRAYEASLRLLTETGIETIAHRIAELTAYIVDRAHETGLTVYGSTDPDRRAGIVTLELPAEINVEELTVSLQQHDIHAAPRNGRLRVAPHGYNTESEIDLLFGALRTRIT